MNLYIFLKVVCAVVFVELVKLGICLFSDVIIKCTCLFSDVNV